MATFIKGLFRLKLFEREATLHLMVDNSANEADGQTYARGIDHYLLGGETYYGHAGFYGSLLVYSPAEGIVLSAHLAQANPPYQVKGLIATVLEILEAPNADCVDEV
jgi:D-alanyl-D-alanine carboxypeptidase